MSYIIWCGHIMSVYKIVRALLCYQVAQPVVFLFASEYSSFCCLLNNMQETLHIAAPHMYFNYVGNSLNLNYARVFTGESLFFLLSRFPLEMTESLESFPRYGKL